jgi:hypothetical protein
VSGGEQITANEGVAGSYFYSTAEQLTSGMSVGVKVKASPVAGGQGVGLTMSSHFLPLDANTRTGQN